MVYFKKLVCVIVALCLFCGMSICVHAEESSIGVKALQVRKYSGVQTLDDEKLLATKSVSYNSKLEDDILNAWDNYTTTVDLSKYKIRITKFEDIYYYISEKYPEYFYLDFENTYYYFNVLGYITEIEISYLYTKSLRDLQRSKLNKAVDEILDKAKGITSKEDKVLFIHDYISTHNYYDPDVFDDINAADDYSFTAYGCLVYNVSVCQGMSDAFVLLCNKLGINSRMVTSEAMCHAWNTVEIGGKYYHLDITWDDSADDAGLALDSNSENYDFLDVKGFSDHEYFMKSDSQFENLDHYSWETEFAASDSITYNNYYWEGVYSSIYFIKGKQYYIKDSSLIRRDPITGQETILYTVEDGYFTSNQTEYKWYSKNAVLAYDYEHNFLLMNLSDGVYAVNVNTADVEKVFSYTGDGYIAGMLFDGTTLTYDVANVSSDGSSLYQISDLSAEITLPEYTTSYGDVNNDGSFEVSDILVLKKYAANQYKEQINEFNADMNEDNCIDAKDILLMMKQQVGV